MCLTYVKPEGSRLEMPPVHIAASTAVVYSRNGSKCFYHGGKLFHFSLCTAPLILYLMHLHLAAEGFAAKFQDNSFRISVLPVKHLEAFFHCVASEEFNQCRLNYPVPCMGLAQHQVTEDEMAIIAFIKNLLFLGDRA